MYQDEMAGQKSDSGVSHGGPGWWKQKRKEEKEQFCISSLMMCPRSVPTMACLLPPSTGPSCRPPSSQWAGG